MESELGAGLPGLGLPLDLLSVLRLRTLAVAVGDNAWS